MQCEVCSFKFAIFSVQCNFFYNVIYREGQLKVTHSVNKKNPKRYISVNIILCQSDISVKILFCQIGISVNMIFCQRDILVNIILTK